MGEAHVLGIGHQIARHLLIGERPPAIVVLAPPAARMDLIDADGGAAILRPRAPRHPFGVLPAIAGDVAHHAGLLGRMLAAETHRVGLQHDPAMGVQNLVLVEGALAQVGQEDLPEPLAHAAHRMAPAVPPVELAHDRHPPRIGRPDRKAGPCDALMGGHMRAQHLPQPLVRAFGQQVQVHLAQHGREPIGVVEGPFDAAARPGLQPIGTGRDRAGEQIARHARQIRLSVGPHGRQRGQVRVIDGQPLTVAERARSQN